MAENNNSELPEVDVDAVDEALSKAAEAIKNATAILLTSGAGLGVDSGLPDFRGPQGFWRAYPPMQKLGLRFEEMSNPQWFEKDPKFAWGFWFHRYSLYSSSTPHEGYFIMKELAENKPHGYFIFTSNVDGHWRKTGIPDDKLEECHGTVGKLARPNVLMFGDWSWNGDRNSGQVHNFQEFQSQLRKQKDAKLVIIEVGAGKAVPTVRYTSESAAKKFKGTLIRINLRDYDFPSDVNGIGVPLGGKDALQKIKALVNKM